jgi:hypothetical protein
MRQPIGEPIYPPNELKQDKEYAEKFGLNEAEFDTIMKTPRAATQDFVTDTPEE